MMNMCMISIHRMGVNPLSLFHQISLRFQNEIKDMIYEAMEDFDDLLK